MIVLSNKSETYHETSLCDILNCCDVHRSLQLHAQLDTNNLPLDISIRTTSL